MAKPTIFETIKESQAWKSIFRHGAPSANARNRVLVVLMNVFLHLFLHFRLVSGVFEGLAVVPGDPVKRLAGDNA
ncbi:MAG: hypothetical protein EB078_07710, partial [Proteobacteria bacterium]|nr:hypothetical protein [Pseudomonadota bacterium]